MTTQDRKDFAQRLAALCHEFSTYPRIRNGAIRFEPDPMKDFEPKIDCHGDMIDLSSVDPNLCQWCGASNCPAAHGADCPLSPYA